MENNAKIIIALLAGLAAGSVIGLLTAPKGIEAKNSLTASLKNLLGSVKNPAVAEDNDMLDVKDIIVESED